MDKGCAFKEAGRLTITTDTSFFGWDAHFQEQGQWSQKNLAKNINCLELRAVCLALREFQDRIVGNHILIMTDNVATKVHINRQG